MAVAEEKINVTDSWRDLLSGNLWYAYGRPYIMNEMDIVQHRVNNSVGQQPYTAVISCSDSRVVPELVFNQGLGKIFTVVTAGNVVDSAGIGSLEFAVAALGVKLIVVMGHTRCGACKAAVGAVQGPVGKPPSNCLEELVTAIAGDVSETVKAYGPDCNQEALVNTAAKRNACATVENLFRRSTSLREAFESGKIGAVSCLYNIETGIVSTIHSFENKVDLAQQSKNAMEIVKVLDG